MSALTITTVAQYGMESEALYAGWLELPTAAASSDNSSFPISGWVLGRASHAVAVELRHRGLLLRRVPVDIERPDIYSGFTEYPDREHARVSGFATAVGTLGLASPFEIDVTAILANGGYVPLARVHGAHEAMRSGFTPAIDPILVTSTGRAGSTLLMRILAYAPRIVVQRLHAYETRWSAHWMHLLKVAAEPGNFTEHRLLGDMLADLHVTYPNPFNFESYTYHAQVDAWLNGEYPRWFAAFCQKSIEGFYRQMAMAQGQEAPRYFAEKSYTQIVTDVAMELYPGGREILLVRDFRDVACSKMRFQQLPGRRHFTDERHDDMEAFVRSMCDEIRYLATYWRTRAERLHLMRYEDLAQHPAETLRMLFDKLDIDLSEAEMAALIEQAFADTPDYRGHRTSESVAASIGRWRRELDPALAAEIGREVGDAMAEFGYGDADT